jgi:hypothetical protein
MWASFISSTDKLPLGNLNLMLMAAAHDSVQRTISPAGGTVL